MTTSKYVINLLIHDPWAQTCKTAWKARFMNPLQACGSRMAWCHSEGCMFTLKSMTQDIIFFLSKRRKETKKQEDSERQREIPSDILHELS